NESITYNTTHVNTYYVRVYGYNGVYNASQCYNLTALLSATNFKEMNGGLEAVAVLPGDMDVYPNPTNGKISVDYLSSGDQTIRLYVMDMTGRTVLTQETNVTEGPNTMYVDLSQYTTGMYVVMLKDASGENSKRVVLQR
ncbi:MAG TPA: T9SS type A sorting domain-containing protein, partial [Chitinophagales bacterium]|nr:T9SS type A sorting domain-containing protein [Chitinophagales bacterium]